jgi:hypothetical protein
MENNFQKPNKRGIIPMNKIAKIAASTIAGIAMVPLMGVPANASNSWYVINDSSSSSRVDGRAWWGCSAVVVTLHPGQQSNNVQSFTSPRGGYARRADGTRFNVYIGVCYTTSQRTRIFVG